MIVRETWTNEASHRIREEMEISLEYGNENVADYLLSRDDFLPSDFIPRTGEYKMSRYKDYRKKAVSHVSQLIDSKGLAYAKTIAADIERILKSTDIKPTKKDIEALGIITQKIMEMDRNAQPEENLPVYDEPLR